MEQLDLNKILQDNEAFEDVFFPPYNPLDINEPYIDFDELHQLLHADNCGHEAEGAPVIAFNNTNINNIIININNNNGEISMNANKVMVKGNLKRSQGRRPRFKRGSVEAAQMKELHRIRNRETASRALERKKAYIEGLELKVQELRKKNANLKKSILFMETCLRSGMTQKQLKRTASWPGHYRQILDYIDC